MIETVLFVLAQLSAQNPHAVVVPNAIVRQHNAYVTCQDENLQRERIRDPGSFVAEVERSIAACAGQKSTLMQQAEAILSRSPEYADPAVRRAAIAEAFDGFDRSRRLMAAAPPRIVR